jgi:hypothetical protein
MGDRRTAMEGLRAIAERNNTTRVRAVQTFKKLMKGTYRNSDDRKGR